MISNKIKYLVHSCLYDIGKMLHTDLFRWHSPQSRNSDVGIGLCFIRQGASELNLHLFSLCLYHTEPRFYIVSNIFSGKRNDGCMFENALVKYCEVSGATTNINNSNTGFQVFLAHDS